MSQDMVLLILIMNYVVVPVILLFLLQYSLCDICNCIFVYLYTVIIVLCLLIICNYNMIVLYVY